MTHPRGDADQQFAAVAAAGGAELTFAAAARTEPFRLAQIHLCLQLQVSNSLRQRQWEALHCAEDVSHDAGPVKAGFAPEKGVSGLNGAQVSRSCPLLFSHRRSHSRASTTTRASCWPDSAHIYMSKAQLSTLTAAVSSCRCVGTAAWRRRRRTGCPWLTHSTVDD